MQPGFHVQQFLPLALQHPGDRDVGPGADDLGDVLGGDLLAEHPLTVLGDGGRLRFRLGQPLLGFAEFPFGRERLDVFVV